MKSKIHEYQNNYLLMSKTISKITTLLLVLSTFYNCSKEDDTPLPLQNSSPVMNDQNFTAAENITDNLAIGTIEATDPDSDPLSFSITINDGNIFEISEAGELSLAAGQSLDFETAQSHVITVAANDGTISTEATITIDVTDIEDTSFISTWQTTTANETVIIPTRAEQFTYEYSIDWGDGTTQSSRTGNATHAYTNAGSYTISISGTFPALFMGDNGDSQTQLRTIEQWGNIQWLTMEDAFKRVATLVINATDAPDLSQVTNMNNMFLFIDDLNGEINHWNVSTVTTMASMFAISSFNQDIGDWDVSNVTDMNNMFSSSAFDQDVSSWNVSKVTNMVGMFQATTFNQDISGWDISNVTDMSFMFTSSGFNQDIGAWDVGNVTAMDFMFNNSSFNQDIGNWNVSNVTTMQAMFLISRFNQDIGDWDVSNVTNMQSMFNRSEFNQDISSWNVRNVTNMQSMFRESEFSQNISDWDVGNVTNMRFMFNDALFNKDLSNWDVSSVTDMSSMFRDSPFNDNISGWDVGNVTQCVDFALNAPLTPANTPNFINCTP